jgi:hypothetical protein
MNPYTTLKIGDIVKHNPSGSKAEVIGIYEDLAWLKFLDGKYTIGFNKVVVIAPSLSPWVSEKKYKKGDLVLMSSGVFEISDVVDTGYYLKNMEGVILASYTFNDNEISRKVGVAV